MKCANCGTEFEDGILFCPVCGKEVQWVPEYNTLETIIQQREIQEKEKKKKEEHALREKKRQEQEMKRRKKKRMAVALQPSVYACWQWVQVSSFTRNNTILLISRWPRQSPSSATKIMTLP